MFDSTADGSGDTVALGFAPIYAVMTVAQANTDALTSIFSFADGAAQLRNQPRPRHRRAADGESISGTDEFGTGETNDGGNAACCRCTTTITVEPPPVDRLQSRDAASGD